MITRACDYHRDLAPLTDLLIAYRVATDVRRYPTLWRVRLLLTSRVGDPQTDTRIWQDDSGAMLGLALLWRRQPTSNYLVLDCFPHPILAADEALAAMLDWGEGRARAIAAVQDTPLNLYANGFAPYPTGDRLLRHSGFAPLPANPAEHNVYFVRPLQEVPPAPTLPPGYTLRRLNAVADLEAYQSLYGFAQVNPEHQRELIESDEYCHIVVAGPDGTLAAYCECSICRAEWRVTGQRLGWIDYIETRAEQQGKGLGRAVLCAGLSQLKQWGAEAAMLVTINTNTPAVQLYERAGFETTEISDHPSYQKHIDLPQSA